ncbi:hypothetical protein D9757_008489 [Collybiopsis confluens]|uniref:Uncharacterized protein n=1 Tax=Collybiopsis confluens TaxID=2823264 RepID=A0A8H5M6C0_9AGAR|nr:hypothetical protein D9757_008489 [Collybiopsis confluens]
MQLTIAISPNFPKPHKYWSASRHSLSSVFVAPPNYSSNHTWSTRSSSSLLNCHLRPSSSLCYTLSFTSTMMMSATKNLFAFLFFTILFTISNAVPVSLQQRDVYTPPITYPAAGTVWNKGEVHNVTWDVSDPPAQITNRFNSLIQLRKAGLTTPLILADDFDILLGTIEVTVPWVITGSDYQLVLFGDSGNFSPEFTINGVAQ